MKDPTIRKKTKHIICAFTLLLILLCLTACADKPLYVPTGEFYKKTSPAIGDGGASDVIDLEAEYLTYRGTGDITVPMTVGFGHMPTNSTYQPNPNNSFTVHIAVYGYPLDREQPAWELTLDYAEDWYSEKFDATEPEESHPFLFIPDYGDFYPLYKENVEIVFPEEITRGALYITVIMKESGVETGRSDNREFRVDFKRNDDVLMLESE